MSLIDLITGMARCLATVRRLGQRIRGDMVPVVGTEEIRDNQPLLG
jgi:hypothetical protein